MGFKLRLKPGCDLYKVGEALEEAGCRGYSFDRTANTDAQFAYVDYEGDVQRLLRIPGIVSVVENDSHM